MTKWITNIMLGFFLLIFTVGFFSQSIINYFIPKVYLEDIINSERLEKSIYLLGTLEPKETVNIKLGRPVIIEEFYYVPGSYVKKGLPLFKINANYGIEEINYLTEPLTKSIVSKQEELALTQVKLFMNREKKTGLYSDKLIAEDELSKYKQLFDEGAVSKDEYEAKKSSLQAKVDVYNGLLVEENQLVFQINSLNSSIDDNQIELERIRKEANFLANVDEEGIYYSEYNGVIMDQAQANELLDSRLAIMEVAKVNSYDDVYLKMYVDEDTLKYMSLNKSFFIEEVGREDVDRIQIVYKSYKSNNNLIEVRGEYKDRNGIPFLGRSVEARFYIRSVEHTYIVPKSAVRISGDSYDGNSQAFIYTVNENSTVLGHEQVAHAVEVSIVDEGDNYVAIRSLSDRLYRMKIISNLTYEIEDESRVFVVEEDNHE